MKFFVFSIVLLCTTKVQLSDGYRILAIIPVNLKSHFLMFEQIMKSLAERDHHVDVVSHFPQKKPIRNYHDLVSLVGTMPDLVNNMTMDNLSQMKSESMIKFMAEHMGNGLCRFLEHPTMKKLISNPPQDDPYDLVITQVHTAHCYLAFGHHLKVPVVAMSTNVPYPWINNLLGNPDNPAYIPNTLRGFSDSMDFWERLQNTVFTISDKFWFNYYTSPQDAMVKKYFGPDAPGVREMERSVALVLLNTHYSLNGVRPLAPAFVEVGGVHVAENGPELSTELEMWLDESTEGFVYFTFGSMFKIESVPREKLAAIYASLANIAPVRVLMKIAKKEELPPGLPENVKTLPWIPQYKVLKHRNVRAFITHGGLMSTIEAVVCGVPMIGIPLFIDQYLNINIYVKQGIAVHLRYEDITEETLDTALNAVMKDPTYRDAARKMSVRFQDRPISAIDTAIFWIEYVIRNGPTALRSPALDLYWWQVALFDVYGSLLLITLLLAYIFDIIAKRVIAIVSRTNNTKVSQTKKRE